MQRNHQPNSSNRLHVTQDNRSGSTDQQNTTIERQFSEKEDVCNICLSDFDCKIRSIKPCGHLFHDSCFQEFRFQSQSLKCPICRVRIQGTIKTNLGDRIADKKALVNDFNKQLRVLKKRELNTRANYNEEIIRFEDEARINEVMKNELKKAKHQNNLLKEKLIEIIGDNKLRTKVKVGGDRRLPRSGSACGQVSKR